MTLRSMKRNAVAAANILFIILIVVLMISASSVVILLYTGSQSNKGGSSAPAANGDAVSVNYIGRLADGRVFDTSEWSVASNDARYPKSLSFTLRSESTYVPLNFTIGGGTVITGFNDGVIGMVIGQTKVIEVPPSEGYGEMNQSKLTVANLDITVPIAVDMSYAAFASTYGGTPVVGATVSDPLYGWNVLVKSADQQADQVTVWNLPTFGQQYAVYGDPTAAKPTGWYVKVTSIDTSTNSIHVQNQLTDADAGMIEGVSASAATTFIVDQVDTAAGTYRMNFNGELVGVTLYFTVTLLAINGKLT